MPPTEIDIYNQLVRLTEEVARAVALMEADREDLREVKSELADTKKRLSEVEKWKARYPVALVLSILSVLIAILK